MLLRRHNSLPERIWSLKITTLLPTGEQMTQALAKSPEVDALLNSIEVDNPDTIVTFGAEAAEEISKASDIVLNSVSMSQLDDSSEMLNTLTKGNG